MSGLRNSIALAAIAGAAAIPLAAVAADAGPAQASPAGEAQVIARDPATGRLRAATAEEMQLLHRARGAHLRTGRLTSATHQHWTGAQGARLTDEFMTYSVVVRTADGKLVELCVEDPSAIADRAAQAKSSTLPTE